MYFIDRRYDFYLVNDVKLAGYPQPQSNHSVNFLKATLLDGELLLETKAKSPYVSFLLLP